MHENTVTIQADRDMFNQPLVDLSRDLWKEIRPAEMMVPIIVGAATVIVCPIAYQLHKEYSWAIYQCVHGDPKTRFRYRGYEVYIHMYLRFQEPGERKLTNGYIGLSCLDHIRHLFPRRFHHSVQSGRCPFRRARILINNGSHSDRSHDHSPERVLCPTRKQNWNCYHYSKSSSSHYFSGKPI